MQMNKEEAISKGGYEGYNEELINENQELKEEIQIKNMEIEKIQIEK